MSYNVANAWVITGSFSNFFHSQGIQIGNTVGNQVLRTAKAPGGK